MDLETAQTTTTAKLPILKQGEYDMWRLRIEQYFQVQDYALWDVIENGNSFKPAAQTTTNVDGTSTTLIPGPITTKEKVQKKNDVKARSMLLMALPNEHLMTFNKYKDAKTLFAAIQTRFGGNEATKKTQKTLLKQITNEVNTAYGVSTANTQVNPASTQVSTASTQVSTANLSDDTVYAFLASQPNGSQLVYEDLEQIHEDDIEEIDLKWEYRGPRNQDSRNRNQDSSRRIVNVEETSSKAMVAIDGADSEGYFHPLEEFQQPEFEGYEPQTSKSVSEDISNEVRESPDAPLVKELVSDDKLEKKTAFPTVAKIEFIKAKPQENPVRKPADYNYHQRERVVSGNNYTSVNYNYSAKHAHPSAHKNMVLRAVLMKTGLRSLNTARPNSAVVNAVRANQGHPQKEDQGYVDSGCSRHMTGNMSYLSDFKEFDGGYVTFGGGAKGGKITGKGTLKTGKLDFEDVYFVKELQFNLFSVSQMCDKKNSVLFTDTGCFVLSPDFKLADESQVLLKVPRKNNMYSVDMKNIVSKKCLTCLVAKATINESMLWHRRLGHVNFNTINKLVKENLVRGLPTKHFENNQTYVACLKGKQHKASFVTDDYSRFTWVFFLATKDETSGILKRFITKIENLVDKKVNIIRCDNETEFKNRVMSEFCEEKGIKKEFSAARTPQQNGVAERRNRTLIKATRTMLANSKLPTTFWAEAVNTTCYVQNRVLVVKPHNKTPYELFRGKFDGKSDEGFFVGYLMNSKAFRVYNIRTMKVEENLHIRFFEDKPIIAGTEESIGAGHSNKEIGSSQHYSLMPLWKDGSLFDSYSKTASNDEPQPSSDVGKKDDEVTTAPFEATHADFFGDEIEVDMSNITTTYPVPSTPNTRVHKDHSLDHVIGDEEPKKVWTLVDLPHGKRAIGTKWVYMNKKDERCIMIRNKARLVAQGYTQEEGIDYDEVFAPAARIEAIRLFLAYASFKDFVVYQMEVKSAFLYGKIEEEVYVCQPLGFEDPEFPDRVYKVEKALYGLHQAPKAWLHYEVFAPVARIEEIRLFLAYLFKDFVVYQMDVKSAFLYGKIEEEVYVCQPPGFEDPEFPDRVYKVENALYGLHQAPRTIHPLRCSVIEEPENTKIQMQAKIFKENSLNKLNALKSTTQLLEKQSILYQQAFAQLFGDSVRTFKFQLSQHMNNLETLLNAETLHEMDSKSALSVIKLQFERFINSDLLKPLDIYSRSFSSDQEVRENFRDYTKMTAQTFKETIIQNMNSIEQM
ncbi:retrovirus-related pol polyprotein from transposon TNT 1-94 [Tanacetum coccineum]